MQNEFNQVTFAKVFLTALFLGMLATFVCFGYDIYYRMATLYGPTEYINVSTIIFIVTTLLLVAGIAYYAIKTWFKKGDLIYTLFFLLVIAFCIWKTAGIHRFTDLKLNKEFIQLLGGTLLITGIAALCIPFFYNNKKIIDLIYEAEV
jgi:hypothetical protein